MAKRPVSASPRRRRDAAATREAILEAATRRFATQGYGGAGVREIAADAGVTAALVNRYFGSKEGLFAEVIRRALDMGHLLQGQRGDLADHLARVMVYGREDSRGSGVLTPLLAPAAFRHGARRHQAVPAGPRPHRASAPRRADRRRRLRGPGRHGHGTAHGVRDHVSRAPPQGVRECPWRRAGNPPVRGPRRLYQVRPRGYGFRSLSRSDHGPTSLITVRRSSWSGCSSSPPLS